MDTKTLLSSLATEQVNARSERLDQMSALEIVTLMNDVTADVTAGVSKALPALAEAVDAIVARMKKGGRLIYMGAGTSGRLGVLDASECPPTFNVDSGLVVGLIAGGDRALRFSSESAEDCPENGGRDLAEHQFGEQDTLVAISASGYAPYCVGALEYAKKAGALCVALSCNSNAPFSALADIAIEVPTGPEVLSGSTRLKAGTATKMVLNMLSTATMIQRGKAYRNMMVDVRATNAKLQERASRLTMSATGAPREQAEKVLRDAGGSVKTAIVMEKCGLSRPEALDALTAHQGFIRRVLAAYHQE